ncbi:hypothetical protein F5Y07DRAFT_369743 [Xylaria sp. FL0933]|nr:hypothetical protein F5Y07DRAFT_369743 [Xylaria sp. FL0933]
MLVVDRYSLDGGLGFDGCTSLSSSRSSGGSISCSGSRLSGLVVGGNTGSRVIGRLGRLLGLRCLEGRSHSARIGSGSDRARGGGSSSGSVSLGCLGGCTRGFARLGFLVLLAEGGLELGLQVGECVWRNPTHIISFVNPSRGFDERFVPEGKIDFAKEDEEGLLKFGSCRCPETRGWDVQ